jgi:hypothetical protein
MKIRTRHRHDDRRQSSHAADLQELGFRLFHAEQGAMVNAVIEL